MLGHDDVAEDVEPVALAGLFEDGLEGLSGGVVVQERHAPVTTECDEMVVAVAVETFEAARHLGIVRLWPATGGSPEGGCPIHRAVCDEWGCSGEVWFPGASVEPTHHGGAGMNGAPGEIISLGAKSERV